MILKEADDGIEGRGRFYRCWKSIRERIDWLSMKSSSTTMPSEEQRRAEGSQRDAPSWTSRNDDDDDDDGDDDDGSNLWRIMNS